MRYYCNVPHIKKSSGDIVDCSLGNIEGHGCVFLLAMALDCDQCLLDGLIDVVDVVRCRCLACIDFVSR